MDKWVIKCSEVGPDNGLFWSNDDGWVSLESCTLFNNDDLGVLNLPVGGKWQSLDAAIHDIVGQSTILDSAIEQLRDIFYGRDTYDNDNQWLDNVESALYDVCCVSGMTTIAQIDKFEPNYDDDSE